MQHTWIIPSPLGHGNKYCSTCCATDLEMSAIGKSLTECEIPEEDRDWIDITTMEDEKNRIVVQLESGTGNIRHCVPGKGQWIDGPPEYHKQKE